MPCCPGGAGSACTERSAWKGRNLESVKRTGEWEVSKAAALIQCAGGGGGGKEGAV